MKITTWTTERAINITGMMYIQHTQDLRSYLESSFAVGISPAHESSMLGIEARVKNSGLRFSVYCHVTMLPACPKSAISSSLLAMIGQLLALCAHSLWNVTY